MDACISEFGGRKRCAYLEKRRLNVGVFGGSGLFILLPGLCSRHTHARADVHMAWSASMQEHLMNKCRASNSLHN